MVRKLFDKAKVILLHFEKMGFLNASVYIFQRIFKKKKLLCARIKNTDLRIYLRNDKYDTQVFTQIFMRGELDVRFNKPLKVIIDGGANIGLATLYLKHKYPQAKIIAVEPEKSNFELLNLNTKKYQDIFCLRNGIWNTNCRLKIIDNGDGNASFITEEIIGGEHAANVINAITITEIMDRFDIHELDLLKLDIEGSEKEVFEKNYENWLAKTKNIIVETHPYLHPDCNKNVLKALGENFSKTQAGEYWFFKKTVA